MVPELFQIFTEAGPLAAMAAYLAWRDWKHSQRHDALVGQFQGQIDKLETKRESAEEALRDRYDAVIEKYDTERRDTLQGMSSGIEAGLVEMRAHYAAMKEGR